MGNYVDQLREYETGTEQQKVRADAEQAVLADCARARQDRVALMILIATATILLVTIQRTRSRTPNLIRYAGTTRTSSSARTGGSRGRRGSAFPSRASHAICQGKVIRVARRSMPRQSPGRRFQR